MPLKRHLSGDERVACSRGDAPPELLEAVRWGVSLDFLASLQNTMLFEALPERLDPRDWMRAEVDTEVLDPDGGVWFDFIADTGDDGAAVAALGMLVQGDLHLPRVALDEPVGLPPAAAEAALPWGSFLIVGGDTGYAIASEATIAARFVAPWNWGRTLRVGLGASGRERARSLYGIPANHDWYDSIDGFNRLFRRRASATQPALSLTAYRAVQEASYFAIRFVPAQGHAETPACAWGIEGIDVPDIGKKKPTMDTRQAAFFAESTRARHRVVVTGEPAACFDAHAGWYRDGIAGYPLREAEREGDERVLLSGDIHHYARYPGRAVNDHIIQCGLGGTLAHPTHVHRAPKSALPGETRQWPSRQQSAARFDAGVARSSVRAGWIGLVLGLLFGLGPMAHDQATLPTLFVNLGVVALGVLALWLWLRVSDMWRWQPRLAVGALIGLAPFVVCQLACGPQGAARLLVTLPWHLVVLGFVAALTAFGAGGAVLAHGPSKAHIGAVACLVGLVVVAGPVAASAGITLGLTDEALAIVTALGAACASGFVLAWAGLWVLVAYAVPKGAFPTHVGAWARDAGLIAFVRFHLHPDGRLEGFVIGAEVPKGQRFAPGALGLPAAKLVDHFVVTPAGASGLAAAAGGVGVLEPVGLQVPLEAARVETVT